MKRYKVAEQLFSPGAASGPSREFEWLFSSFVAERMDLYPIIYRKKSKGLDNKAIMFYEDSFRKIKPDLVVIRGLAIDGFCAIVGAKKAKVPCILTGIHGMYSELVYYSNFKKFVARIIESTSIKYSDFFYTVCDSAFQNNEMLKKQKKKYLGTIYNAKPDYSECDKAFVKQSLRSNMGIPQNACVGIYVGRLSEEKGIRFLCKSLIVFFNDPASSNFFFVFVGNGPAMGDAIRCLGTLVGTRVFFAGVQNSVKEFLLASDLFVFPSLHENSPISVLEACEANLFIVSTNVGGIPEIVLNGVNGALVNPGKTDALFQAIKQSVVNKTYLSFDKKQWSSYSQKFSSKAVAERVISVYENAIQRSLDERKNY